MEEKPIKEQVSVEDLPPSRGQRIGTILLSVSLCGVLVYALLEHHSAKQIAARENELSTALSQERSQVQTLAQKLLAAESAPPAPAARPVPETGNRTLPPPRRRLSPPQSSRCRRTSGTPLPSPCLIIANRV